MPERYVDGFEDVGPNVRRIRRILLDDELDLLDAVDTSLQSQIDTKKPILNAVNVGSYPAGVSVWEYGDGFQHTTFITITDLAMPSIPGGTNLRLGKLIYTFPVGEVVVKSCKLSSSLTQTQGFINDDTPEIGLGTTLGAGVGPTLTAIYENIAAGLAATNANGAIITRTIADQTLVIGTSDSHGVYLNMADDWAVGGDSGALLNALIIINWTFLDGSLT